MNHIWVDGAPTLYFVRSVNEITLQMIEMELLSNHCRELCTLQRERETAEAKLREHEEGNMTDVTDKQKHQATRE